MNKSHRDELSKIQYESAIVLFTNKKTLIWLGGKLKVLIDTAANQRE
jgi:hypothetical protein